MHRLIPGAVVTAVFGAMAAGLTVVLLYLRAPEITFEIDRDLLDSSRAFRRLNAISTTPSPGHPNAPPSGCRTSIGSRRGAASFDCVADGPRRAAAGGHDRGGRRHARHVRCGQRVSRRRGHGPGPPVAGPFAVRHQLADLRARRVRSAQPGRTDRPADVQPRGWSTLSHVERVGSSALAGAAFGAALFLLGLGLGGSIAGSTLFAIATAVPLATAPGPYDAVYVERAVTLAIWISLLMLVAARAIALSLGRPCRWPPRSSSPLPAACCPSS